MGEIGFGGDKPIQDGSTNKQLNKEEVLKRKAQEIAKLIKEKGAGILRERMPPNWFKSTYQGPKLEVSEYSNIGQVQSGAFSQGEEARSREDVKMLNNHIPTLTDADSVFRDSFSRAQIEEFGIDPLHVKGRYFITTQLTNYGWTAYRLNIYHDNYDGRPYAGLRVDLVVPPEIAQQLDVAYNANPEFPAEFVKSLYPDTFEINSNPDKEIVLSKMVIPPVKELWLLNRRENPAEKRFWKNAITSSEGWTLV